jgi:pimeloyl-ACP methyl ester carboxylesterase
LPLIRRLALALERNPTGARGPAGHLLLGELAALPAMYARRRPDLRVTPAEPARDVMLLPGFLTDPSLMRPLRLALEAAGHRVGDWGEGLNAGFDGRNLERVCRRIAAHHEATGQPLALVGWSLGGMFAREAARRVPHAVDRVITLGSPFSADRRANNAWRLYHLVAGHSVDDPPGLGDLAEKPPVRTVAVWSAADGIVSPDAARGRDGERDAAIEVHCRHMLLPSDRDAVAAVLAELDRPAAQS